MQPFVRVTGVAAPMDRVNVDTDQIIPKQFLKRIEKTGFGPFLFFDWRFLDNGEPNLEFELNRPGYEGATILVAGRNFGCGSSREHAPWALLDYGFRAIIAPSFADIFYNNSAKNGVLLVQLPEDAVQRLLKDIQDEPGSRLTVDLERQIVDDGHGFSQSFEMDPFRRHCLLQGLDDVGLTLQHEDAITAYEAQRAPWLPVTASA